MIFSSYIFVFVFLPLVLLFYFGMSKYVSQRVHQLFLILASLVFYAYAHPSYVVLILSSVFVNYFSATGVQLIEKEKLRKLVFGVGILFNVCLLGYYKYTDFFTENINEIFDTTYTLRRIILPVGISFFTFQQIAYLIGVWKRELKVPPLADYVLFITFFPQLVAGPIVFAQDVMSQYQDCRNRYFNLSNFNKGLFIFAIGLFKKIVIADSVSLFVSNGYVNVNFAEMSTLGAWMVSLSYTLQIFFDFSAYSEMAIGAAKMFNINLPVNFYSPYKAKSITEFWQRWHITLGRSLAVLIYYPLGGNRKGLPRTCLNLFLVFLVSGIWHGAAWTFIIWGIMHGVVRVFEKLFEKQLDIVPTFIRIFFTFIFVNTAWVLFRSPTLEFAWKFIKKMYCIGESFSTHGLHKFAFDGILNYPQSMLIAYFVGVVGVLYTVIFAFKKNSIDLYNEFQPNKIRAMVVAIIFCVSVLHMSRVSPFIYFNF